MTRDDLVTLMKQRFRREADTTLDARIISEMIFQQATLLEGGVTLPWFLLSENLTATTTIGDERLPIPKNVDLVTGKDFLREYEEGALWIYDASSGKWKALIKEDYDNLLETYPSGTDTPKYYSLDGEYFRLKPTPDAEYTVRIKCYLRAASLSTNVENAWLKYAADLMMGEVGTVIAARHLRDPAMKAEFEMEASKARARMFLSDEARKHANRNYVRGD